MTTCPWTPDVAASLGMPFTCATLETPTTYRVRFDEVAGHLPTYRVICISKLGADYGDKGTIIPTCADHDVASRSIEALIAPPAMPLAMAIPQAGERVSGAGTGGYGRPESGLIVGMPSASGAWPPGVFPDPSSPVAIPPVPLPGAMALLAVALVMLTRLRR